MKNLRSILSIAILLAFTAGLRLVPQVSATGNEAVAPLGTGISDDKVFEMIEARIQQAGQYTFTATVEQTLVPRPVVLQR